MVVDKYFWLYSPTHTNNNWSFNNSLVSCDECLCDMIMAIWHISGFETVSDAHYQNTTAQQSPSDCYTACFTLQQAQSNLIW